MLRYLKGFLYLYFFLNTCSWQLLKEPIASQLCKCISSSLLFISKLAQGCINANRVVMHGHLCCSPCQDCVSDSVCVCSHGPRAFVSLCADHFARGWPGWAGSAGQLYRAPRRPPTPGPVGNPGQWWHGHKSTDTEHVEAFRRQTHHLLPAGAPLSSLPSSAAAPLLSVKCKLFPWK